MGASMYPIQLSFSQVYKTFRDIVVYPNVHNLKSTIGVSEKYAYFFLPIFI